MPLTQDTFLSENGGKYTVTLPHSGSSTSKAAAHRVASRSAIDEARLRDWIQEQGIHGATDEEIRQHFDWSGDYARPRRWNLGRKKLIQASGKRDNARGNKMTVWVAATAVQSHDARPT